MLDPLQIILTLLGVEIFVALRSGGICHVLQDISISVFTTPVPERYPQKFGIFHRNTYRHMAEENIH